MILTREVHCSEGSCGAVARMGAPRFLGDLSVEAPDIEALAGVVVKARWKCRDCGKWNRRRFLLGRLTVSPA